MDAENVDTVYLTYFEYNGIPYFGSVDKLFRGHRALDSFYLDRIVDRSEFASLLLGVVVELVGNERALQLARQATITRVPVE